MVPGKHALEELLHNIAASSWEKYLAAGSGRALRMSMGSLNGSI